jgi:hypothetical protein
MTSICFVQCAEEFEAVCSNIKSSAEESRLIGVDEITSMKNVHAVCLSLSVNPFCADVHMCTNLTWSVCRCAWPCTISCPYRPDRSDPSPESPADRLAPCISIIDADHRDHAHHVACIDHSPVKKMIGQRAPRKCETGGGCSGGELFEKNLRVSMCIPLVCPTTFECRAVANDSYKHSVSNPNGLPASN